MTKVIFSNSNSNTSTQSRSVRPFNYVSRDTFLSRLTTEDAALVCEAEEHARVSDGQEYIDLHHVERGVRKAKSFAGPLRSVLPKEAIGEALWLRVVKQLPAQRR